jgi:hypothetical protein
MWNNVVRSHASSAPGKPLGPCRLSFDALGSQVIAGGAIHTCLKADVDSVDMTTQTLNADVDVFLYGLNETEARTKIKNIFEQLKATGPLSGKKAALALRTPNTVSEASVLEHTESYFLLLHIR